MSGAQEAPSVFLRVAAINGVFRRAGFVFEKQPRVIACTPTQAAAIRAENKRSLIVHDSTEEELHSGPRSEADLLAIASAANESLGAKLDAALEENEQLAKANADAQARLAALDELLASRASRIAELEAQLAKANADLDALTAPKPDAKPEAEAPKGKPAKG